MYAVLSKRCFKPRFRGGIRCPALPFPSARARRRRAPRKNGGTGGAIAPPVPDGFVPARDYSPLMAPVGQAPSHAPQSTQTAGSTLHLSPSWEMASTGQVSLHAPQPTQTSVSIFLGMVCFLVRACYGAAWAVGPERVASGCRETTIRAASKARQRLLDGTTFRGKGWCARLDLNQRRKDYESSALTG